MEVPPLRLLISFRSVNKHGRHRHFLFLVGQFLKIFSSETALPNEPKLCMKPLFKVLYIRFPHFITIGQKHARHGQCCFWLSEI
jgi:hypothetical protein